MHTAILWLEAAALLAVAAADNDADDHDDWSEDQNNQKSAQSSSGGRGSSLVVSVRDNVESIGEITLAFWNALVLEPISKITSSLFLSACGSWNHVSGLETIGAHSVTVGAAFVGTGTRGAFGWVSIGLGGNNSEQSGEILKGVHFKYK